MGCYCCCCCRRVSTETRTYKYTCNQCVAGLLQCSVAVWLWRRLLLLVWLYTGVSELLRDSQDYRCRPGTVHSPVHVGNTPVNGEGWGKLPRGFIDRFIKRNVWKRKIFFREDESQVLINLPKWGVLYSEILWDVLKMYWSCLFDFFFVLIQINERILHCSLSLQQEFIIFLCKVI